MESVIAPQCEESGSLAPVCTLQAAKNLARRFQAKWISAALVHHCKMAMLRNGEVCRVLDQTNQNRCGSVRISLHPNARPTYSLPGPLLEAVCTAYSSLGFSRTPAVRRPALPLMGFTKTVAEPISSLLLQSKTLRRRWLRVKCRDSVIRLLFGKLAAYLSSNHVVVFASADRSTIWKIRE